MAIDLFPAPTAPPSTSSPRPLFGSTPESTEALRDVLKDNHERWHLYYKVTETIGFHNHSAHWVLALWALGADKEVIRAAYNLNCTYQLPSIHSPEAITSENFKDHLGDAKYYQSYRKYFANAIQTKGVATLLEEFIFDPKMNYDGSSNEPQMLTRFWDGLLHPMIHLGYGAEFGLPGMIVEGLAFTAVHGTSENVLTPASLWESRSTTIHSKSKPSKNTHALAILARVLKDTRFEGVGQEPIRVYYQKFIKDHVKVLIEIADGWSYDASDPKEVERKIEELVFLNVFIYGVSGWKKDKDFNADLLFMHLVTSSLFLSSISALLKPSSQEIFLRSYLIMSLSIWIIGGRPSFNIPGFFAADTAYPTSPGPFPTANKTILLPETSAKYTTPNPWFPIVQNAVTIADDHLPKLQRALLHFGQLYGTRAPGHLKDMELPSADLIDGTLFIRVAGLTNKRVADIANSQTLVPGTTMTWDMLRVF